MGHFEEFELAVKKVNEYPLIYEALIPQNCYFFQDVRRYQSLTGNLNIRMINVDGCIELEPDMVRIPISKLTASEKKEFVEYLKMRISRGDNIGSYWAFFRSMNKKSKTPVVGFGVNIVHSDPVLGQERARNLLKLIEKRRLSGSTFKVFLKYFVIICLIATAVFAVYEYGYKEKRFFLSQFDPSSNTPEMRFYKVVFPQIFQWRSDERPFIRKLANDLLKPEYVKDLLAIMDKDFYLANQDGEQNLARRMTLFVYFNYNQEIVRLMEKNWNKLEGTEFLRLAKIYSTKLSGYISNIFYFKVGDLDLKRAEIANFLNSNMVSYQDYTKLRDINSFAELLRKDGIGYQMQSFLEDVYTLTPLKIKTPLNNREWYMLVQKGKEDHIDFVAFFRKDKATLVPRRIGDLLLHSEKSGIFCWYAIDEKQASALNLSDNSLTYFSKPTGQTLKLELIADKINKLKLKPINFSFQVTVHRELLMEDNKGKYGIQCYDPITSLVLSNLITRSSFEKERNVVLKRDPIQFNTTLVQLSRDDSFSIETVTITPGKTAIIRLFEPVDSFKAIFQDGKTVIFEKAAVNIFNPFSFMVFNDSIAFSFKHDITDMIIDMNSHRLKITKSIDGNYQIKEIA